MITRLTQLSRRLVLSAVIVGLAVMLWPLSALAAGSITASGGGTFTNGSTFTMTVKASGATFDSLQGTISVTGPVSIVSFSAGGATWLPGKTPANNSQFVGITSSTSSLTVATIKLKGTKEGSGKVTVSGVRLAKSGSEVGTGGGSTSFTISRAPTVPGAIVVSSTTHPNPDESYEATTAELAWTAPANGAAGYGYVFDQVADTAAPQEITTTALAASFPNLTVGTYYFHVRAKNNDGWGETTHFKLNVKHTLDPSLGVPLLTEIVTNEGFANDIEAGTLTGLTFRGTGPAGYKINLIFVPEFGLPVDKYTMPTASETGEWEFVITDPVKAGFYKLTLQAEKEGMVSAVSQPIPFEVLISDGGGVKMISPQDATAAYQETQEQAKVLAAREKSRNIYLSLGLGVVILIGAFLLRRRLLALFKRSGSQP